jgi:hypothetical protein
MGNVKLAAWRAGRTEEVVVPSGLTVTVRRRITLEDVIMSGDVPKPLLGLIQDARDQGGFDTSDTEKVLKFMPMIDQMVRMAIIDPPLADVADDEHMSIDELPAADRLALFVWLVQPAAKLAPFRPEPGGVVAVAPGGDDVQL